MMSSHIVELPMGATIHNLKTVLIVDDDLGFVFWLGHALDAAAYSALPARTIPDAALLIMQLNLTVDVLLINPRLSGGHDFIATLHRSQGHVKVIGILDYGRQLSHIKGVSAHHTKPTVLDEDSKNDWLQCIRGVLMQKTIHDCLI
jgi:DNA-binding NtrC family response regulator